MIIYTYACACIHTYTCEKKLTMFIEHRIRTPALELANVDFSAELHKGSLGLGRKEGKKEERKGKKRKGVREREKKTGRKQAFIKHQSCAQALC